MSIKLIKCPKDPEIKYYREVCEEIFRKGRLRYWCKECNLFKNTDEKK
ncbi:MAG: hypothetical protein HQK79_16875 [Desulfobacterales bacterium]|nr:hypothetical protein [Desulfobacterales bacterium]